MKSFLAVIILSIASCLIAQENLPYKNSKLSVDERVADLLKRMTLEEKIDLLGGTGFATKPNERLGIPELRMSDGPVGVRWSESTAFPVSIAMSATWDPAQVEKVGSAIGREVKGHGRDIILGPCVNIARIPQGGRNFESFGEDPFLTSRMAVDYIRGVQKEDVAATVKHYAANNQEYERDFVNTIVSERALNEIYFPHFKAAVEKAGVLCVMSAYNKVNGAYCSENDYLLVDKLKKDWGFKGLVMSDWGAVHSTLPTANSGLDLEMPVGKYLNQKTLLDEVKKGTVPESKIDNKVSRILGVIFKLGLFDHERKENSSLINSAENRKVAYETSRESIVLLKNDQNVLPMQTEKIKSIAVIGPDAEIARTGGGGSAMVTPIDPISALQGLKNKLGDKIKINFAAGVRLEGDERPIDAKYLFTDETLKEQGLTGNYFNNKELSGSPTITRVDKQINFWWGGGSPAKEIGEDNFSVRWTGVIKAPATGKFVLSTSSDDGIRLYVDDKLVINDWTDHALTATSAEVEMTEGKTYKIRLEYYEFGGDAIIVLGWKLPGEDLMTEAVNAAKSSDVALVFAGTSQNYESEGRDRDNLSLPNNQDELIQKIAKANPNTVVILQNGSPVLMNEWIDKVKGIVEAWFPGVEGGNAIADVLLGNYNPSGKLPVTFPKRWEDCSAYKTYKQKDSVTVYDDGIFVGYRHFDKNKIEPLFPFGYGLSYTTFEFDKLKVEKRSNDNFEITFAVTNTGKVKGAEVAQVYVSQVDPKIEKAVKELKNFIRIDLKPGQSSMVKLNLKRDDFAYYDEQIHGWEVDPGKYKIMIGGSSNDLKLQTEVPLD
ncbi:MAG: glycoside hydrolase family 3 C-terminal domain-containing protein [Bacteroidetes bacterium]|nr:glycoside hydrolase family 3 C-terminal domain-containing protein [Bacteroidota bacterium]